jgi:hypothetical protein
MSRWIEHVKQFSRKHKISYKDAMCSILCKQEYSIKGGSIPLRNDLKYAKAIMFGRDDYPPKVRNILKRYGNEIIVQCRLKRTPVSRTIIRAMSVISLGETSKRLDKSDYDKLFHLFLEMTTQTGKRISVEKNEVINMEISPVIRPEEEIKTIQSVPSGLTIGGMMNKTRQLMGRRFYKYDASNNNCQDFIVSILKANGIGDHQDIEFVKQDTDFLFKNLPYLKKFSNTVTTIGSRINVLKTGAGFI